MTNKKIPIIDLDSQAEIVWNDSYDSKFSNLLMTNDRLFGVLLNIGYKAALGVAVTLTELIHQKSHKFYPLIDVVQEFAPKIESLWAGTIDPFYLSTFRFDFEHFSEDGSSTPYSACWFILFNMARDYIKGSGCVQRYLVNLSMLACHLMSNKRQFDSWFTEVVRKTTEIFPYIRDFEFVDNDEVKYDYSDVVPVPREFFFDPEFQYSEETAKPLLNKFLQSLDYNNNPWLCTPERMLEKGFKGTPYTI